ncbi:MAG: hypothetical protein K5851_08710 [Lachnospiraceae bacterium]|nr:hypothetical protein [Lachnospiraceae bacterium]
MNKREFFPGWDKKYVSEAKKLNVFYYSARCDEEVQGVLNGFSPKDVIRIYKKIKPCKCGASSPKALETECMGDFEFSIICNKCGRRVIRTMYDFDVKMPDGWIGLCIRDWNNGVDQEEIEAANDAEHERISLKQEDVVWNPLHPNNMADNPLEGYYALLFRKERDGNIFGYKWTIKFQYEEIEPALSSFLINSYILFGKRYMDLDNVFTYPKPIKECEFCEEHETGCVDGVNDYGDFFYAYRSLEEAKEGALARCAWNGLNRDTIMKQ